MKYFFLIFFYSCSLQLFAQNKVEKEYRVDQEQVPDIAVQWLQSTFSKTKKLKWFLEESSGKKSYEAKFCYLSSRYSVEFSTTGQLEDIEIERKWSTLKSDTRKKLRSSFDQIPDFKRRRIQEQWTGSLAALESSIKNQNTDKITVRFEVEFTGKMDGERGFWEGLFNAKGNLLEYRRIILSPTDNLDF